MNTLQSCFLCAADTPQPICEGCAHDLPRLPRGCPRCAEPHTQDGNLCGECLQRPPAFDQAQALFGYGFPVDRLVQALKYSHSLLVAEWLGRRLAVQVDGRDIDAVIALPLHPDRLRQRGFNQSLEIARPIARHLHRPLLTDICERTRATPPQADMPLTERARNVRHAFACNGPLGNLHILLVDDVMTTGATLHECARALKEAGARTVSVAVAARAVRNAP